MTEDTLQERGFDSLDCLAPVQATFLKANIADAYAEADRHPVAIVKRDKRTHVLMSANDYRRLLALCSRSPVGEGRVLVPVEPTHEMLAAAYQHWKAADYPGLDEEFAGVYRAMLLASLKEEDQGTAQGISRPSADQEALTPGPWSVGPAPYDTSVFGSDGFQVADTPTAYAIARDYYDDKMGDGHWATTPGASREVRDGEGEANARLIAAAPELLEAAKALDDFWIASGWKPPGDESEERLLTKETLAVWRSIRAAIAKATSLPSMEQPVSDGLGSSGREVKDV